MGGNPSKASPDAPPQVWKSSSPAGVSSDLAESLQKSSETDTTRAQTLELHIQARVAEELKRLQSQQDTALKEAQEKLSQAPIPDDASDSKGTGKGKGKELSSRAVSEEVDALRKKLEQRQKVHDIPAEVERARSEVVRCLRENDRRPLDCWREVEAFKSQVRSLEEAWVKKVME